LIIKYFLKGCFRKLSSFCKRLISATELAFRRVCGEPPRRLATLSGITCPTHPAGQGRLRQRYIARRKAIFIFEESHPFAPINYAMKNLKNSQLQRVFRKERIKHRFFTVFFYFVKWKTKLDSDNLKVSKF
jgi:hypothetical protein